MEDDLDVMDIEEQTNNKKRKNRDDDSDDTMDISTNFKVLERIKKTKIPYVLEYRNLTGSDKATRRFEMENLHFLIQNILFNSEKELEINEREYEILVPLSVCVVDKEFVHAPDAHKNLFELLVREWHENHYVILVLHTDDLETASQCQQTLIEITTKPPLYGLYKRFNFSLPVFVHFIVSANTPAHIQDDLRSLLFFKIPNHLQQIDFKNQVLQNQFVSISSS